MKSVFSSFLLLFRKKNKLTQEKMVSFIQSKSNLFPCLDSVTVSRWENDITSPSFTKKVELLLIIGTDFKKVVQSIVEPPKNIQKYNKFPKDYYTDQSNKDVLTVENLTFDNIDIISTLKNELDFIFEYEQLSTNFYFEKNNIGKLHCFFKKFNLNISIYKSNGRLVGHLISSQLDSNTHWSIINRETSFSSIYRNNKIYCNSGINNNYLIIGLHCGNSIVFEHVFGRLLEEFIFNNDLNGNLSFITKKRNVANSLLRVGLSTHTQSGIYTISNYDAKHSKSILEIVSYTHFKNINSKNSTRATL